MVPKVNSGANVYGVLQYNRIKVEAGEGRILYMQGIPERSDGRFSIEECAEAFGYYTALNPRVRKPVVHFSLNPSPEDRLSADGLVISETRSLIPEKMVLQSSLTFFMKIMRDCFWQK